MQRISEFDMLLQVRYSCLSKMPMVPSDWCSPPDHAVEGLCRREGATLGSGEGGCGLVNGSGFKFWVVSPAGTDLTLEPDLAQLELQVGVI